MASIPPSLKSTAIESFLPVFLSVILKPGFLSVGFFTMNRSGSTVPSTTETPSPHEALIIISAAFSGLLENITPLETASICRTHPTAIFMLPASWPVFFRYAAASLEKRLAITSL